MANFNIFDINLIIWIARQDWSRKNLYFWNNITNSFFTCVLCADILIHSLKIIITIKYNQYIEEKKNRKKEIMSKKTS